MTAHQAKRRGIVLMTTESGEADLVVTLYTAEDGLLRVIAKGARRSRKRFVNKLERFSLLDCRLNRKYRLPLLEEAELIDSHLALRLDFDACAAADLICQHLRAWGTAGAGDRELLDLLLWALARLCRDQDRRRIVALFLARLHARTGYQPSLDACAVCGRAEADRAPYTFQPARGTMVCRHCATGPTALPLSPATIRTIEAAAAMPLATLDRLRPGPAAIAEMLTMYKQYGRYPLDRDLAAWKFFPT